MKNEIKSSLRNATYQIREISAGRLRPHNFAFGIETLSLVRRLRAAGLSVECTMIARFHTLAMKTATKTVKLPHLPARKEAWPWSDDVVADRADAEIARLRVSKKPDPFAASNARKPREQK